MTDAEKNEIRTILDLTGWEIIQEMLKEDMPDVVEGDYESIAVNVLAKNKAKNHITYVLNKINGLKKAVNPQKESFK